MIALDSLKKEIIEADKRIRSYIRKTPLEYSPYASSASQGEVFLKLENLQITGSFKLRGALNKILSLREMGEERVIVTASTGNHGVAVAYALQRLNMKGFIFVPENISEAKLRDLKAYNVEIRFHGEDCVEAENHAREFARENGMVYISPYNDVNIVAGQGTVALEIAQDLNDIDTVIVPVGGGGLISGIASYLKSIDEDIEIIGAQPENSRVMYESIKAGRILDMESRPTISDGTAGGIEKGSITFEICKRYVDNFIILSEDEIKDGIRFLMDNHHMLVEGAGALSIAAYFKEREKFKKKRVILIVSGCRISMEKIKVVVCGDKNGGIQA